MKKVLTSLFLIMMIISWAIVCSAAPEPKAKSAVMASMTSEQIMFSKDPDRQVAPAEFTKLMTAYTAYKIYGFDTVITVPEGISLNLAPGAASMSLKAGEQLKSQYLICGILIERADDAAFTVALNYGGVDKFVKKMNEYAKALDMENTVFTNVTGKNDEKQFTTANDLLKLYREVYKEEKFYEILASVNVEIPQTNMSEPRTYWTKNHLMSRFIYLDYVYPYAHAGLSSSTEHGGYSVISTAKRGEREYVCLVLDSVREENVNCAMTDATELFEYGFNNFTSVTVSKKGELAYEAKLKNQRGKGTLLLSASKTMKAEILDDDDVSSVEKKVVIEEPVKPPVKKGDVVGKIVYSYNGNFIGEVELIAERDVKKSTLRIIFGGIGWFFGLTVIKIIIGGFMLVFMVMVITAYVRAKRRRRRRRNRRSSRYYRRF